jgi:hypothetical protein
LKGETVKRIMFMAALVITGLITAVAVADAPSGNKITCFGDCTQPSPNRASFGQGGVYIPNQPGGQLIGDISKLSFDFDGTGAVPGSPRFSIAINTDGISSGPFGLDTNFFVFADVLTCNNGSTTKGELDVINDPTCPITTPTGTYPNWAALVAANPTWHVAGADYTFVISDSGSPQYTVFNVQILTKARGGK